MRRGSMQAVLTGLPSGRCCLLLITTKATQPGSHGPRPSLQTLVVSMPGAGAHPLLAIYRLRVIQQTTRLDHFVGWWLWGGHGCFPLDHWAQCSLPSQWHLNEDMRNTEMARWFLWLFERVQHSSKPRQDPQDFPRTALKWAQMHLMSYVNRSTPSWVCLPSLSLVWPSLGFI